MRVLSNAWGNDSVAANVKFFGESVLELTNWYSAASYRHRSLSTTSKSRELAEAVGEVSKRVVKKAYLGPILDEYSEAIVKDPIVDSILRSKGLSADLLGVSMDFSLETISAKLKIFHDLIDGTYSKAAIDLIVANCSSPGKPKELLRTCADNLVSHFVMTGISREHIHISAKREFATVEMAGDEIAACLRFFSACERSEERYDILISTTNTLANRLSSILSAHAHQSIETLPPHFRYGAFGKPASKKHAPKRAPNKAGPFALVPGMPGSDPFAAAKNFKYILELFHAFHFIYPNEADWDFPHSVWVYEKTTGGLYHSTISEYVHHGRKIASKKTYDDMLSKLQRFTFEKLGNEDNSGRKILSALRSASAASRISEKDARLISIWSAFEALLPNPSKDGENTVRITHFESYITPLVTSSYIDDMYRNFYKDLSRNFKRQFLSFIDKNSGGAQRYTSFLNLFFAEPSIKREFTDMISSSELLLHRAHELEEIANDPKKLKSKLSGHETRVSWQLHRIYRARNSIVHSGVSPRYCPQLTENAFSYFKSIMALLVHAGNTYGVSNSDALFELCASICRHRKKELLEMNTGDKQKFFLFAVAPPTIQVKASLDDKHP